MVVKTEIRPPVDEFSETYAEYIEGQYDCVDRIVLNAYWSMGQNGGGFRVWWRSWQGSDDGLNTARLMRFAREYARRLRAYAEAEGIPVIDCESGVRKHELAETYIPDDPAFVGVFAILVSKFSAPTWHVKESKDKKRIHLEKKYPFVKQYWFHIMDPSWGHITIRLSPHPPFGAQIFLNGHEYVARQAQKVDITLEKESNSFANISDPDGLAEIADTLCSASAIGQLGQVCDRWIYSTCLHFALSLEDQRATRFKYNYSVYQTELSRNLIFNRGPQMEQIFDSVIDHMRSRMDIKTVKTIFGTRGRPHWRRGKKTPRLECVIEKPMDDLTIFKVHFSSLTLKMYTKGENTLHIEVIAHNVKRLPLRRSLKYFGEILDYLKPALTHFLNTIQAIDAAFIDDGLLDSLPEPASLGASKLAGIHLDQPRIRAVLSSVLALAPAPTGFTASQLANQVKERFAHLFPDYSPRQAAYDLKKLRAKNLVTRIGNSRKYSPTPDGLQAISALIVLRDHIIKPVLAGAGKTKRGPKPKDPSLLDELFSAVHQAFRNLLLEFSFAIYTFSTSTILCRYWSRKRLM